MAKDDNFGKYMKGLDYLHARASSLLSSILAVVNHKRLLSDSDAKKIYRYHDIPEYMLDREFLDMFLAVTKDIMSDYPDKLNEFLKIIDAPYSASTQKVKSFMEKIPPNTILKSKDTLEDAIHLFANMPTNGRYLLVMDGKNLVGLMSVADFNNNFENIKSMNRSASLMSLPFITKEIKTLSDNVSMAEAREFFRRLKESNLKITKLLVVDKDKKPVGYLDEGDISRWEASSLES